MKKALRENNVVYICGAYISALKLTLDGSYEITDLTQNSIDMIKDYPSLMDSIESGRLVQITNDFGSVNIVVGDRIFEGAYNENEALDVVAKSSAEDLELALGLVDSNLSKINRTHTVRQRLRRTYHSDRFK